MIGRAAHDPVELGDDWCDCFVINPCAPVSDAVFLFVGPRLLENARLPDDWSRSAERRVRDCPSGSFLGRSALVTGGAALSLTALGRLSARSALAASGRDLHGVGYGPLAPVKPSNPEEIVAAGFPDLAAFPIIPLPGIQHHRRHPLRR